MKHFFKLKRFSLYLIPICWFLIHTIIVLIDGIVDDAYTHADTAVVLGNKVNEDGSLSSRLRARLDKCLELHSHESFKFIVVSGGLGKEGHFEGSVMANYLVLNGVPKKKIIIDNQGNNTWLTAKNFARLKNQFSGVVLISQFYHITRCKLAFRKCGIPSIYGASPSYFEWKDFYSVFREFFGYYYYWLGFRN